MSADVVGYSLLMGGDESATLSALKAHRAELIDPAIAEYGGRIPSVRRITDADRNVEAGGGSRGGGNDREDRCTAT